MDAELTEKFLADGKLTNFAKLRDKGCYKKLWSTVPPISPVAWSSFLTGVNPGKHNIFDFLSRDKRSYAPILSSVHIGGARRSLKLGKYEIPIGKPEIRLLRKSKPFWYYLGEQGIFSNIIRVPLTFPPEKFRGVLLSAMCVPDLRGSQGTFSYYTTQETTKEEYTSGERYHLERNNGTIKGSLIGPGNPIRIEHKEMLCEFEAKLNNPGKDCDAILKVNGDTHKLKKGVYTDWAPVEFKAAVGMKVKGICQFLLLATEPEFELYVTPINIDPAKPVMPISHPMVYSTYLAKNQGAFATLGLAEDSWGLNAKVLDDNTFLHQCIQADKEREKMFFDALSKVKRGLCACVFDGTDRVQHSFWRYIDQGHPADPGEQELQQRKAIEQVYERADKLLGKVMAKCDDDDTVLMVISDHGFNSFRYGVDLNYWLEQEGYLKMKETSGERDKKYLQGVDWSQTKAYAIGLAGIFLNLQGRESHGIVKEGPDAEKLREEIAGKLRKLHDPIRDKGAIKEVYNARQVYTGPYKVEAPDLIVGYEKGYRVSWETAVGQITDGVLHDNIKAWSGDHCIDQSLVPGVLFCNRQVADQEPRLMDIGVTVLDMFGVDIPRHMDGKPLQVVKKEQEG